MSQSKDMVKTKSGELKNNNETEQKHGPKYRKHSDKKSKMKRKTIIRTFQKTYVRCGR